MDKTNDHPVPDEFAMGGVGGPGHRLITYNLLNSALASVQGERQRASLALVEDLSTFVGLFCFYDGVVLLGSNWEWFGLKIAKQNDLAAALVESDFIHEVDPYDLEGDYLDRAHAKHLAAFLQASLPAA